MASNSILVNAISTARIVWYHTHRASYTLVTSPSAGNFSITFSTGLTSTGIPNSLFNQFIDINVPFSPSLTLTRGLLESFVLHHDTTFFLRWYPSSPLYETHSCLSFFLSMCGVSRSISYSRKKLYRTVADPFEVRGSKSSLKYPFLISVANGWGTLVFIISTTQGLVFTLHESIDGTQCHL